MNKQNIEDLDLATEKKYKKRERKKRLRMKISGGEVKKLQKIIMVAK